MKKVEAVSLVAVHTHTHTHTHTSRLLVNNSENNIIIDKIVIKPNF